MSGELENEGQLAPSRTRGARVRVAVTLGLGLAVLAAALAFSIGHAVKRTGTNEIRPHAAFGPLVGGGAFCQEGERIPSGTGGLRVSLERRSGAPPALSATIAEGSRVVASGHGSARWDGKTVTVPLRPTSHRDHVGEVCLTLDDPTGRAATALHGELVGEAGGAKFGDRALPLRLRLDYLAPVERSWWSFASTVAERIGFGNALPGTAAAWLAALLTVTSIALAAWQLVRSAE